MFSLLLRISYLLVFSPSNGTLSPLRCPTNHNYEVSSLTSNSSIQALRSIKNLAPLLDRVLVQRIKAEAKTAGGIFLPESSVEKLNEAKVLAVGPGGLDRDGKRITMGVGVGDKVLIPQVYSRKLSGKAGQGANIYK